jgi:hypothetical protein
LLQDDTTALAEAIENCSPAGRALHTFDAMLRSCHFAPIVLPIIDTFIKMMLSSAPRLPFEHILMMVVP